MWRMLCERATDLRSVHSRRPHRGRDTGSAHWSADYTFTTTGRKVHNAIDASFLFTDGLITAHRDSSASTPGRARLSGRSGFCSAGRADFRRGFARPPGRGSTTTWRAGRPT